MMTCEICKDSGLHPMVSPWEWKKKVKERNTMDPEVIGLCRIEDAPCPSCRTNDFWGFISALTDKHGPPFDTGEDIIGAHIFQTIYGTVTIPTTAGGDETFKKKGIL